jgi:hypothetical protein
MAPELEVMFAPASQIPQPFAAPVPNSSIAPDVVETVDVL